MLLLLYLMLLLFCTNTWPFLKAQKHTREHFKPPLVPVSLQLAMKSENILLFYFILFTRFHQQTLAKHWTLSWYYLLRYYIRLALN